jgi:hypothetical protein
VLKLLFWIAAPVAESGWDAVTAPAPTGWEQGSAPAPAAAAPTPNWEWKSNPWFLWGRKAELLWNLLVDNVQVDLIYSMSFMLGAKRFCLVDSAGLRVSPSSLMLPLLSWIALFEVHLLASVCPATNSWDSLGSPKWVMLNLCLSDSAHVLVLHLAVWVYESNAFCSCFMVTFLAWEWRLIRTG